MRFAVALRPLALSLLVTGAASAQPAPAVAPADPVAERAQALTEASGLLTKAGQMRARNQKNLAEMLFSSAELIVGAEALADLAPLFREGAPPRVTTPLKQLAKDTPPQPQVGASDDDEPAAPKPKLGVVAGSLQLAGKPLPGRGVVTLEPASGKWRSRPPKDRVMEQRNRDFAPKVLVVRKGSSVAFPNYDGVYHNVFSRSDTKAFDLGIYKNGQSREVVFDKPGIVRIGCDLHANMAAYIVVVDAPRYAITDEHGDFKLRGLQPGKYRLRAYTEKSARPVVQDVTVAPDATATVVVAMTADAAPPNLDKFGKPRGK